MRSSVSEIWEGISFSTDFCDEGLKSCSRMSWWLFMFLPVTGSGDGESKDLLLVLPFLRIELIEGLL